MDVMCKHYACGIRVCWAHRNHEGMKKALNWCKRSRAKPWLVFLHFGSSLYAPLFSRKILNLACSWPRLYPQHRIPWALPVVISECKTSSNPWAHSSMAQSPIPVKERHEYLLSITATAPKGFLLLRQMAEHRSSNSFGFAAAAPGNTVPVEQE